MNLGPLMGVITNVASTTKSTRAQSSSEPTTTIEWGPPFAFGFTVNWHVPVILPAEAVHVRLALEIQSPAVVRFMVT